MENKGFMDNGSQNLPPGRGQQLLREKEPLVKEQMHFKGRGQKEPRSNCTHAKSGSLENDQQFTIGLIHLDRFK